MTLRHWWQLQIRENLVKLVLDGARAIGLPVMTLCPAVIESFPDDRRFRQLSRRLDYSKVKPILSVT